MERGRVAKLVLDLIGIGLEIQTRKPSLGDIKDSCGEFSGARLLLGHEPRVNLRKVQKLQFVPKRARLVYSLFYLAGYFCLSFFVLSNRGMWSMSLVAV
jgi:hypothetical protein